MAAISWRERLKSWWSGLRSEQSALIEVVVLFLPGIPALIWFWPEVSERIAEFGQILVYLYFIVGAFWIGLRRWKFTELGINHEGILFSLGCGALILIGRSLVIRSVDWGAPPPVVTFHRLLWGIVYYFGLVGLCEELLFRGLVYRALDNWLGVRWAIWGSSVGFAVWHIGQGPLVAVAMLFYGLVFALIRWRSAGIVGLVIVHGLIDFSAMLMLPGLDVTGLGRPNVPKPGLLVLGLALLVAAPLITWMVRPGASSKD